MFNPLITSEAELDRNRQPGLYRIDGRLVIDGREGEPVRSVTVFRSVLKQPFTLTMDTR